MGEHKSNHFNEEIIDLLITVALKQEEEQEISALLEVCESDIAATSAV